jgi:hypothetical protein
MESRGIEEVRSSQVSGVERVDFPAKVLMIPLTVFSYF